MRAICCYLAPMARSIIAAKWMLFGDGHHTLLLCPTFSHRHAWCGEGDAARDTPVYIDGVHASVVA